MKKLITILLLSIPTLLSAQLKIGPSASSDIGFNRSVMFEDGRRVVNGMSFHNYFGVSMEVDNRVFSVQYGPQSRTLLLQTHILFEVRKKRKKAQA